MNCQDVERLQVIEGYLRGSLSPESQEEFEKHYLECDRCFAALQLEHSLRLETSSDEADVSGTQPARSGLFVRYALPIAAALLLILVPISLVNRDSASTGLPAELTAIELMPPYVESTLRGAESAISEEFRAGMRSYADESYEEAADHLGRAAEANPDHLPTRFFLGLSLLASGSDQEAVGQLEAVASAGDSPYLEEARWYLAKGYFRLGRLQDGRGELEAVRDLAGSLESDARRHLTLLDSRED